MLFALVLLVLLAADLIDCFGYGEEPTHWQTGACIVVAYGVVVTLFPR